jgi:hypothetical protein
MGNVVAVPIRTQSLCGDACAIPVEHVLERCLVLPFRKPATKPQSRWVAHGKPDTCAHCRQPFPEQDDRSEAQAGRDGRLYCHGSRCERDAAASRRRRRRSAP